MFPGVANTMDLLRVHQCFFSFEDVEELVEALRQSGSPVCIESSCKVEDCNRVVVLTLSCSYKHFKHLVICNCLQKFRFF